MKKLNIMAVMACIAVPLMLGSCGSKKKLADNTPASTPTTTTQPTTPGGAPENTTNLALVRKVIENATDARNIVSSIDFNIKSGKKDITVDGKICMRRDEVIRIQLSPMGLVEVGRLEFSRDSVLIMDRIHKQYLKSGYDQVSFLKNNGIDFYALQALFWNQLFEPGKKVLSTSEASHFDTNGNQIVLQKGKMGFLWNTDDEGRIAKTVASYNSSSRGTSKLDWNYADFKAFGNKMFPTKQSFTIQTEATGSTKTIGVTISMKKLKTDSDWETTTKVPSKYTPVNLKDVINQILKM